MRFRFRLRAILLAIVLLSPPLAGAAIIARHGGLKGFQDYHAREAHNNWAMGDDLRMRAETYQKYGEPPNQIESLRRRANEYFRKAHWHEFLSGRPIERTTI